MQKKFLVSSMLIYVYVFVYFFSQPASALDKKPKIAVYELKAVNADDAVVAITLSEILRKAIFNSGQYEVLTREDMKEKLYALAQMQQIQPDCNSEACLSQTGKALRVDLMISGSFTKNEKTYAIDLQLIDTKKARITNVEADDCSCAEEILVNKIQEVGLRLLGLKPTELKTPVKQADTEAAEEKKPPTLAAAYFSISNMVLVKGGCYAMGDIFGAGYAETEKPVHEVCVDDFYIDKYEVSQKDYQKVMRKNPSYFQGCEDCPVEQVTWYMARDYCEKLGKRLPSEAEWEYAARSGGKQEKWAGANSNFEAYVWGESNSGKSTHPVGQKKPNNLGIYDMSGNVWEWCSDWYNKQYYRISPRNNPQGPAEGEVKVLRGGSWLLAGRNIRCASRDWLLPDYGLNGVGFRCAGTK